MTKEKLRTQIIEAVNTVKNEKTMAASITNSVTLEFVINAQIAIGGTPGAIFQNQEGEAFIHSGDAMSLNLGSFTPDFIESIPKTAERLNKEKQNWVLDPVGISLGAEREELFKNLKKYKVPIIRGNASEIINLSILWGLEDSEATKALVRGADSTNTSFEAEDSSVALAKFTGGVVVVTGETDLVTDGYRVAYSYGGSKYMPLIIGSGDSLTGILAIYAGATDPFTAALSAVSAYNVAGKRAERNAQGPGTFKPYFIDELYNATAEDIAGNDFEIKELD